MFLAVEGRDRRAIASFPNAEEDDSFIIVPSSLVEPRSRLPSGWEDRSSSSAAERTTPSPRKREDEDKDDDKGCLAVAARATPLRRGVAARE